MQTTFNKALRCISMLLLLAMLTTSQTFVVLATEITENIDLADVEQTTAVLLEEQINTDDQGEKSLVEKAAQPLSGITLDAEEATLFTEPNANELNNTATIASTEEEVLEEIYTVDQPFHFQRNDRERVVLNTGAVNYSEELVSVPAMGNNDLRLQLNYDSAESALIRYNYYLKYRPVYIVSYRKYHKIYYASGTKTIYYDWTHVPFYNSDKADAFLLQKIQYSQTDTVSDGDGVAQRYTAYQTKHSTTSEAYTYGNSSQDRSFNESRYDLGAGWSFNLPSIDYGTSTPRLILPGKGAFAFSKSSVGNHIFKDYSRKDMVLTNDSSYNNDQFDSSIKLKFADGTAYYFDESGRLLAIVDRFGNTITYNYEEIDGEYHPSAIIDTTTEEITGEQHRITITYTATDGGKIIAVAAPDGSITELHTKALDSTLYGEGNSVLDKIVYADGETIHFDYAIEDAAYSYSSDADETFKYILLNKVTYATGSELYYTYEMQDTDLGNGHLNTYRLTERYTLDPIHYNTVMDKIKYSYTGDYSRNTTYKTKVTEIGTNGNTATEYTFNKDHLCTTQTFYAGNTQKQIISTSYDDYDLPQRITTTVYGTDTLVTTERYTHDEYGNTTSSYSTKAEGSTTNTEYKTTFKYEDVFWFPQSVTHKQDAGTTIVITNVPTAQKDNIDYTEVKVNGVLVAKTKYTYDDYGRTQTATDCLDLSEETGIVTRYEYSGALLASKVVQNVLGNDDEQSIDLSVSYTYDKMGRVLTETDGKGNTTTTAYDTRGRVASIIQSDGNVTTYTYDLQSNYTTVASTDRESITYHYNPAGLPETSLYASGDLLSETFYDEHGRVIAEATGRGSTAANTAYYTYDAFDRVTEKLVYDAENVLAYRETYSYDDAYTSELSLVTHTVHGSGDSPNLVTKTYTNKYGEVVKEDVGGIITEYAYDYVGNPIRVYYGDTTLATYTYDHNGNVLTEKNAAGDTRSITYDATGRKIAESDFMGNETTYTYDNAGRLLTMTAPLNDTTNSVTKYYYDANGNVTKQQQSAQADDSTEVVWRTVEQTYDSMNRVTDIKSYASDSEKQYTHYEYNLAGDLTDVYTGLSVPWALKGENATYSHIQYTYDSRGNNTAITDALNKTETYEYDALGMLVSATQRDGKVTRYTYNAFGNVVSDAVYATASTQTPLSQKTTEYTLTGAVASVTMDGETIVYTYDGLGNVLTETEGNVVKAYTYDPRGRKSGYTLTIGDEVKSTAEYAYDDLDRLISVTEGGETTTYTYDKNGNRTGQQTGEVAVAYTYNKANLVTSMTNSMVNADGDSIVISSVAYTYYTDGNMRTKTETMLLDAPVTTTYVYDGMGRLLTETKGETSISYCYDANGNRTWMNNDGVITTYTYDANNRLMTESDITYTYDDNGNTLTVGNKTYTYNARGQQTGYTEHADPVHAFTNGKCTFCREPATYTLGDADGNGVINFLDFLVATRYYTDLPEELPPQDLDGDGVAGKKDYLIFARELGGIDENYIPNPLIIDDLLAFADVDGNGEVGAADYLLAYATLYEKEISECLTNGISLKTSMQAADINGDGTVSEADKEIGIDFALSGSSTYPIGETVENTYPCVVAGNRILVSAQYAYNPSGLRSAKTVGGSTKYFVYNGMNIVYEYENSISDGVVYYYGLNRTHNSDGEIYVYNAHGDTVQLVKDNAVVASYTYDAFGNLTSELCDNDNTFLYCSEYFDAETKTYYLRARYYNPANGRFTQQDAWAFMDTADPLSLNLYTYCGNNPVMYVDPSGNCIEFAIMATTVWRIWDSGIIQVTVQNIQNELYNMQIVASYQYNWSGEYVTTDFLVKTYEISEELGINADYLMGVMAFESWLDPTKVNGIGATGLIQFMPKTAIGLGTTTEELKQMSAIQQLDYVYEFLKPKAEKMNTLSDVYMAVLWPAAVGKDENYVLWNKGTTAYKQNNGLDINSDGKITKAEATQKVIQRMEYYGQK